MPIENNDETDKKELYLPRERKPVRMQNCEEKNV